MTLHLSKICISEGYAGLSELSGLFMFLNSSFNCLVFGIWTRDEVRMVAIPEAKIERVPR